MARVYQSRIDWWLAFSVGAGVIISLTALVSLLLSPVAGRWLMIALLAVLGVILPVWVFSATYYTLSDDFLDVRSGPFRWKIPVSSIVSVTSSRNPLSSPALSLNRLEVMDARGRKVLISPREMDAFQRDLEARRSGLKNDPE